MKKYSQSPSKASYKTPAGIAIIVTALVLLAALIFGIVWTSIDHSYRYDRADLSQFFKDGTIRTELEEMKKLPLRLETTVTAAKVEERIETNLSKLSGEVFSKYGSAAVVSPNAPFKDIVSLYYEVITMPEDEDVEPSVLMSEMLYAKESEAEEVQLGKNSFNEVIEKYLLSGESFYTLVNRKVDTGDAVAACPGYTMVLDLKMTYEKDDAEKTYLTLTDYYYQPDTTPANPLPEGGNKSYYKGNDKLISDKTAKDSSVKTISEAVINAVNAAIADKDPATFAVGDKITGTVADQKLDTAATDIYDIEYEITLKSLFLAEVYETVIDFDSKTVGSEDNLFYGMKFKYKDASGSPKELDEGKLRLRLTLESVLSLNKATVEELTKEITGFTPPTGDAPTDDDYANAYIAYVKKDLMDAAVATQKEKPDVYAQTVRGALWEEIVEHFVESGLITSYPEKEYKSGYEALYASYVAAYENLTASEKKNYASADEYILVKEYENEEAKALSKADQAAAVEKNIGDDVKKAIVEKIVLFAMADEYGITVSRGEWKEFKENFRASRETYYSSFYGSIYASTMSEGEIKVMAKDLAKQEANSYGNNYYRECVYLEKLQKLLVPTPEEYTNITWTYDGEADAD